jgi:hypothetical protein
MSDIGKKHDDGKPRMDLLPPDAIFAVADVFTYGAELYGARDWEKGLPYGRLFAAILRHLFAWWMREEVDRESGKSHLAHAATGVLMLLAMSRRRQDLDDRPKNVCAGVPIDTSTQN